MPRQLTFLQRYRSWLFDSFDFHGYTKLFDILYGTEFVWTLPMDANRESDGRHLRVTYEAISGTYMTLEELDAPCSFLEMLVALAQALYEVIYVSDIKTWVWVFLDNIGVSECDDVWFDESINPSAYVKTRIDDVMLRRYRSDGDGGIFPLTHTDRDQRGVELWYQLNEYIMDQELV